MQTRQQLLVASMDNALVTLIGDAFQIPRLKALRIELESARGKIWELATRQMLSDRPGLDGEITKELRDTLRTKYLKPISADAEVLLEGTPGLKDSFRIPHKRDSDEKLLVAAERIFKNASTYRNDFVDRRGYAPDFIACGKAAADALKARLKEGNTVMNRRSRATASLPKAIAKGRKIMDAIDKTVVAELGDDQSSLEMWKASYRVPKKIGRPTTKRRAKRRPVRDAVIDHPDAGGA
jgi:hypothetical protein